MIVKLEKCASATRPEVIVRYAEMNQQVERIFFLLQSIDKKIPCRLGNEEKFISVFDIYYFESVDKKTFIYCEKEVYNTDSRIYQLAEELAPLGFVQISKSFILNINVLDSIKPLPNSRIEATLKNGEKVFVTRKYLENIRQALQEGVEA
ncbi:MAG: LytTR family transcriptional regulator DNA-binding domain-containing protein [Defluviitaleaceae bacterium]|nr:LytTR family transcriptional regulator DNA-binding domain-containing protein [Defluviitaleaceae bacterium]